MNFSAIPNTVSAATLPKALNACRRAHTTRGKTFNKPLTNTQRPLFTRTHGKSVPLRSANTYTTRKTPFIANTRWSTMAFSTHTTKGDYGLNFDITPARKSELQAADLALYSAAEIRQHLTNGNQAALHQQQNEQDKHDPMDHKRSLDMMKIGTTLPPFGSQSYSDEAQGLCVASTQGHRPTMEDAHTYGILELTLDGKTERARFSALLDGHGGDECANFCANRLKEILHSELEHFNPTQLSEEGIFNALTHASVKLSHAYNSKTLPEDVFNIFSGSTLNIVLEAGDHVYCANLGDSRALFISEDGKIQQLTADHTLTCPAQRDQIEKRGGSVASERGLYRINGRLAVAAALGAHWTNGAVSARPRISVLPAQNLMNGVIVQACDGLFEVASTQQFGQRIYESLQEGMTPLEAATDVICAVLDCGSRDNLSVIVRQMNP